MRRLDALVGGLTAEDGRRDARAVAHIVGVLDEARLGPHLAVCKSAGWGMGGAVRAGGSSNVLGGNGVGRGG